jgi:outer membrane lipoprotein-sorting protein
MTGVLAQTFDAGAVIDKTVQIYKEWGGMDVNFTMRIFAEKSGINESFEGAIRMKNNKFVWTTPDMTIWFDGTTQWTYMSHSDEVSINTPDDDELRYLNPMMFLQGYKKDYNITAIGESTSAHAKAAFDIKLTPKKKDTIEMIEIQVEKNTALPVKLVITMRQQSRMTIQINELKAGNPPDEQFLFPQASYPNVTINDLR